MSTPRRLQFRVGSSLLSASLALAGSGCDDSGKSGPTANPALEQQPSADTDSPTANPKPVLEPTANPAPIPGPEVPVHTNEGPEPDPEPMPTPKEKKPIAVNPGPTKVVDPNPDAAPAPERRTNMVAPKH